MRKFLYWLLPLSWMGVIFYASSQPYEQQDIKPLLTNSIDLSFLIPFFDGITFVYHHAEVSVDALGMAGFIEFFVRKGAHVGVYFILLILLFLAFRKTTGINYKMSLSISFFITVAYAISDEYHQGFTENRTPYIGDVFLDSFGALAACLVMLCFFWIKKIRN